MARFTHAAVAALAALLPACAMMVPPRLAAEHYDGCEAQTSSFVAMVACGKQRRLASCTADANCSSEGNAVVAYADALADSVKSGGMTDAEARRKWIEFKLARSDQHRPRTCHAVGSTITCD